MRSIQRYDIDYSFSFLCSVARLYGCERTDCWQLVAQQIGIQAEDGEAEVNFGNKPFLFDFETKSVEVRTIYLDETLVGEDDKEGVGDEEEEGGGGGEGGEGEDGEDESGVNGAEEEENDGEGGDEAGEGEGEGEGADENNEGEGEGEMGNDEDGEDEGEDGDEEYMLQTMHEKEKELTFLPHIIPDENANIVYSFGASLEDYYRSYNLAIDETKVIMPFVVW